jgi:hypothetical protein
MNSNHNQAADGEAKAKPREVGVDFRSFSRNSSVERKQFLPHFIGRAESYAPGRSFSPVWVIAQRSKAE